MSFGITTLVTVLTLCCADQGHGTLRIQQSEDLLSDPNFTLRAMQPRSVGHLGYNPCDWSYPVTAARPFDVFAAHLVMALSWIGDVLDPIGIKWWVDGHGGTALGIYRHQGQIPHTDDDADIRIDAHPFQKAMAALSKATSLNGSPFFLIGPLRWRAGILKASLASHAITHRCHVYNVLGYPAVLDQHDPWHIDIRSTPPRELPKQFCRCKYYNLSLLCPTKFELRLVDYFGTDWWLPSACRLLPANFCRVVGNFTLQRTSVPVIAVEPRDPAGTETDLALMGIHPWRRVSNASMWCRWPRPHAVFRKMRLQGGAILPQPMSRFHTSPIVQEYLRQHRLVSQSQKNTSFSLDVDA